MSVYAQEYGYFFNSNNHDRTYNAESFETWLKPFFISGVFAGSLQVKAQATPDMTVQVTPGYANLNGKPAHWTETNTLQIATASGVYDRIDTVVLRRDNTNRTIAIEVVTGTASLNPSPTAPTRNADVYELVLAQIRVGVGVTQIVASKITDKRPDSSVCGYVMATVQTPDFSELFAQFQAQAAEALEDQAEEFDSWKTEFTEDADEWAGEFHQDMESWKEDFEDSAEDWQGNFEQTVDGWYLVKTEEFEEWLQNLQDQLDDNQAAHLQNEIDDINAAFRRIGLEIVNGHFMISPVEYIDPIV